MVTILRLRGSVLLVLIPLITVLGILSVIGYLVINNSSIKRSALQNKLPLLPTTGKSSREIININNIDPIIQINDLAAKNKGLEFITYTRKDTLNMSNNKTSSSGRNWFHKNYWKQVNDKNTIVHNEKETCTFNSSGRKECLMSFLSDYAYYDYSLGRFMKDIQASPDLKLDEISKSYDGMVIYKFSYTTKDCKDCYWEHWILENGFVLKSHLTLAKVESLEESNNYSFTPFNLETF